MDRVQVQFGGRGGVVFDLETNEDLVAIRTCDTAPVAQARLSGASRRLLDKLEPVTRFRDAGVEVFHVRDGSQNTRDAVRTTFKAEKDIRFAGRVLSDPVFKPQRAVRATQPAAPTTKEPVLYSENLFVKFSTSVTSARAKRVLSAAGLQMKRAIPYLDHAYFVAAPEHTGLKVFAIALTLLRDEATVELCHPELIRPRSLRAAFPQQWHLQNAAINGVRIKAHASVVDAWAFSKGKGTTIAIIDTGIDIDHEEFAAAGKIVAPRDTEADSRHPDDPRPQSTQFEKHGTASAGVACAIGRKGASGVAPEARLMPIRLVGGLGSQDEADAFAWAADKGADVISCSWGPTDGKWFDPTDATHRANVALPDNTRLAIEHALTNGRGGKGCVICWAAGNGNESVDNDGYASHPGVIAVAACNDTGKRSVYSDTGKAIWCSFPSNDFDLEAFPVLPTPPPVGGTWNENHPAAKTPGIWTTDWSGGNGYNPGGTGSPSGDVAGNYTNAFGGTSSATPGVAGVAALILSANKALRQEDVREIIKRTCDRIDPAKGTYDPTTHHSLLYGFGRVNALNAVKAATKPLTPAGPGGSGAPRGLAPRPRARKAARPKRVPGPKRALGPKRVANAKPTRARRAVRAEKKR